MRGCQVAQRLRKPIVCEDTFAFLLRCAVASRLGRSVRAARRVLFVVADRRGPLSSFRAFGLTVFMRRHRVFLVFCRACVRQEIRTFREVVMAGKTFSACLFFVPSAALAAHSGRSRAAGPSAVMLVSGVSAAEEMCFASVGGRFALESCLRAVHEGDGDACRPPCL